MDRIGVGVIGCGFVGRGAHLPALNAIEAARLVAAADPDAKRLDKAARKYSLKSTYRDYADLVRDPEVDAVVVAAPTPLHTRATLAAIAAGKHVLCEMPLAANLEEVDKIVAAADERGVCVMPGLTFRFTPNYVKAKERIDSGALGNASAVLYRELIPAADLAKQWPPGAWVWNIDESGGPLYTLAVWSIDLFRWLLDTEVEEVEASTRYTRLEKLGGTLGYDCCAILRLASGVVGCVQYSGTVTGSASTSTLEIVTDSTCTLRASGNDSLTLLGDDPATTEWKVGEPGARSWGHHQQDEYFVHCIREGRAPEITPEDGRRAMEIASRIAAAAAR